MSEIVTYTVADLERLRNAFQLRLACTGWSGRGKVESLQDAMLYLEELAKLSGAVGQLSSALATPNGSQVRSIKRGGKSALTLYKTLLPRSETLARLRRTMYELRKTLFAYTMPNPTLPGVVLCKNADIAVRVERLLRAGAAEIDSLVEQWTRSTDGDPKNCQYYRDVVAASQTVPEGGLGPLFAWRDYPTPERMRDLWGVGWEWFALIVPEGLPREIREAEVAKYRQKLQDSAAEITNALRVMFAELIAHAVERLTVAPGEKPKIFRDSCITNIQEFLQTFDNRAILRDAELEDLVGRAREVLTGATPELLRSSASVRESTQAALSEIKTALDGMIETQPERPLTFE